MDRHEIDAYIDKTELEFRSFMTSYYKIMSYSDKVCSAKDLSDDDKEIINITMTKMAEASERV